MLVRSGRERRKGRYGRTVGVGRRLPFPICFSVMFAFCYQAYALPIKRRKGKKKKRCACYRQPGLWLFCAPVSGVGSLWKALFVSVIWKYRIGLQRKNGGVSTFLASCYFPVVLTRTRS